MVSDNAKNGKYDEEQYLEDQLIQLEIEKSTLDEEEIAESEKFQRCSEKSGIVTLLEENYGLIDGHIYFDRSLYPYTLKRNDRLQFLTYRPTDAAPLKVVKIINCSDASWEDDIQLEDTFNHNHDKHYDVIDKVIVGQVTNRRGRTVILKENDLSFNLDDVDINFIPIDGDWLQLTCKVQWNSDVQDTTDINGEVLEVISIEPLRTKIIEGKITQWLGDCGICNNDIYVSKHALELGCEPARGAKVIVEAIESYQGACTWRALSLHIESDISNINAKNENLRKDIEHDTKADEEMHGIIVPNEINFESVKFGETQIKTVLIENSSDQTHILIKWCLFSSRKDSQLIIYPPIQKRVIMKPHDKYTFKFTCRPKVIGHSREQFLIIFDRLKVIRWISMNVEDSFTVNLSPLKSESRKLKSEYVSSVKKFKEQNDLPYVPGVRPIKPPAFVPVKLGMFPLPKKLWTAVLGNENEQHSFMKYSDILMRIEKTVPSLTQTLNISNYTDKWHALIYLEEIELTVLMRQYDMEKAFLIPQQEFLCLEMAGLSERRPSLMKGDSVKVKSTWDESMPIYEGFIHEIYSDKVLLKFNQQFHEKYTGYDVSLKFDFSKSKFRRCHQAINLALSNLGPEMLFPTKICTKTTQTKLKISNLTDIEWFNQSLNYWQKQAVKNILLGEARPMPYCIFGPPGTGKTITVVEAILQILHHLPESRILVTTPSNSSANLLTERLIECGDKTVGTLIRILAYHLIDSDTVPVVIRPYCATLDIAKENTSISRFKTNSNGIRLSCQSSFIAHHRVIIGTCSSLGNLAMMGLPKGHFTHVIVDEAGQATEPEIMVPFSFINKDNAQVLIAGDPMQLGPVVMSKYAAEYGLPESYMSRLIQRRMYQKDEISFKSDSGYYDSRLVTKLLYNYRSLPNILSLPSSMFYDDDLQPQITGKEDWVYDLIEKLQFTLPSENGNSSGGIYFCGVRGKIYRAVESPSWYNVHEASMVLMLVCKLYKQGLEPEDIGIITPYIAQVKWLKNLFIAIKMDQPKIGSVEEFQGQERKVIVISTVRSNENMDSDNNIKHVLGFLNNPKRLNVAITRAQFAVVLYGNPHALSSDHSWRKVIEYAIENGNYTGCDIPYCLQKKQKENL